MNLASVATLAVAALDLQLVQDLVGAIRAADAGAIAAGALPLAPLPTLATQSRIDPEPRLESVTRDRLHESPCYQRPRFCSCDCAPKPLLHALPRLALSSTDVEGLPACDPTSGREKPSPIQPPWAVRSWQEPVKPPAHVKVVQYRTDIVSKGSLIDMFI